MTAKATSADDEISKVLSELEQIMAALRGNVGQLQAILTEEPEVPGEHAVTA